MLRGALHDTLRVVFYGIRLDLVLVSGNFCLPERL
jgi:hypothetical protein